MGKPISRPRPTSRAFAVGVCGLLLSARAHAEASAAQKAAAESLFDDALKAMKAGRFVDACPKLEESERIDPGIGTLLYLGECYEKTGRTASAWATFREAASSAQARGESDRARVATARADRLQPGLSKLTIQVAPETRELSGLRVNRDNAVVQNSLFGVALPVDPGRYHLVATADGYETFEGDVEIAANGESKTFAVPSLKPGNKAAAAPAPGAASTTDDASRGPTTNSQIQGGGSALPASAPPNGLRTAAYVSGAVGIVGVGIGSYFGVRAISKNSNAETYCPAGDTCKDARGVELTNDAKHAAVLSNVAIGIGAAFVVGGVVLYLSSEPKKAARLQLHPWLSRELAGVGFGGAFR